MPRIRESTKDFTAPDGPKSWQEEQAEEQGKFSLELMFAEVRVAHTRADELEDRIKQRKRFAYIFVGIAAFWLLLVLLVVVLHGTENVKLDLSEAVILALIGTGTAHAIAPAILVAKYLFGVPKEE